MPLGAQEIDTEVGLWVSGPVVSEVDHRVRLGNRGQEMYLALRISDHVSEHWRVGGDVLFAPAHLYVYEALDGNDGWFERPKNMSHRESVSWLCSNVGAWYDTGWLETGAGLGGCHLSGLDYSFFGSGPMHVASSRLDVAFSQQVTDGMAASLRCRVNPTPVRGKDFTVLQIASGELQPGEHDSNRWHWHISGGCGLSLSIEVGR